VNVNELFHDGKLREATIAAVDSVRLNPTDSARRLLLAQLLCFSGEFDRADGHVDAATTNDPKGVLSLLGFRQLIRAEQARQEFFHSGRVPEVLSAPDEIVKLTLEASVHAREGELRRAAETLGQVEDLRPKLSGVCDGQPFEDFRDLDDLTCCVLEVLTVKGDYYLVPFDRVESLEFHAPEYPRDLLWRRAHLVVRDGPDAEVFIPVLYPGAARNADDLVRLGRATDWTGGDGEPVRGVGQRTFLVGDQARTILELHSLTFDLTNLATKASLHDTEPAPG
jgi:type VI secretion system protein ImpE